MRSERQRQRSALAACASFDGDPGADVIDTPKPSRYYLDDLACDVVK